MLFPHLTVEQRRRLYLLTGNLAAVCGEQFDQHVVELRGLYRLFKYRREVTWDILLMIRLALTDRRQHHERQRLTCARARGFLFDPSHFRCQLMALHFRHIHINQADGELLFLFKPCDGLARRRGDRRLHSP